MTENWHTKKSKFHVQEKTKGMTLVSAIWITELSEKGLGYLPDHNLVCSAPPTHFSSDMDLADRPFQYQYSFPFDSPSQALVPKILSIGSPEKGPLVF